jgi:RNA polymerase subunit RPABC4/transcription elongation factor Spt4
LEEALARGVQIFLALSGAYLVALWFALAVWAYRDIGARSQSVVTQIFATLLVVVFSIPGALLYLLLRPKDTLDEAYQRTLEEEYLLNDLEDAVVCHSCQRPVAEDFVVCPHCQAALKESCHQCTRLISVGWAVCPFCGANQSDQAATIREQLPPPAERFVDRRAGTFGALPPASIRAADSISPASEMTAIGGSFPAPGLAPGAASYLNGDSPPVGSEPIRLFDRRKTRMLRAANQGDALVSTNGVVPNGDARSDGKTGIDGERTEEPAGVRDGTGSSGASASIHHDSGESEDTDKAVRKDGSAL